MYKNEVNLRTGSSHFIINREQSDSDCMKEELIISIKQLGKILKPCFEIRRFEDLSIKRHIKSDFSASSILIDKNDLHCLIKTPENNIQIVRASIDVLQQLESDRIFGAYQKCLIKDAHECFDGIYAT